jgi:DNA invertase Pin-like site-specific DNA recombinase
LRLPFLLQKRTLLFNVLRIKRKGMIFMKVAIYGKTDGQSETNEQVQKCREYAQKNNYEVANEFVDDQDTDGKSFEQLIEAAQDFDGVVIQDRMKLAKDANEREMKLKALRETGLETVFVNK